MSSSPKTILPESIHSIIHTFLKKSGKPTSVKEITKIVLENKQLKTKTPQNTINAILQRSEYFVKVSRGTYSIKSTE
tara:strand:+ start:220 stop:450 length:231 start_codon:yes stop_codon:yes gene_type:complete